MLAFPALAMTRGRSRSRVMDREVSTMKTYQCSGTAGGDENWAGAGSPPNSSRQKNNWINVFTATLPSGKHPSAGMRAKAMPGNYPFYAKMEY